MDDRPGLLGTPLGQFGLGAVALVVGGALLFWLIGAVSGDTDGTAAAPEDGATTFATTETPTAGTTEGTTSPPASTEAPTDAPTDAAPTDGQTTDTPTQAPAIDPATIAIQVLEASDEAADQDGVVACLESGGYDDLITGNRAVSVYPATTVFYTPGEDNQAAAQQVADTLGIGSVEEKPDNLSDSVPVHVVTGQDGADLC